MIRLQRLSNVSSMKLSSGKWESDHPCSKWCSLSKWRWSITLGKDEQTNWKLAGHNQFVDFLREMDWEREQWRIPIYSCLGSEYFPSPLLSCPGGVWLEQGGTLVRVRVRASFGWICVRSSSPLVRSRSCGTVGLQTFFRRCWKSRPVGCGKKLIERLEKDDFFLSTKADCSENVIPTNSLYTVLDTIQEQTRLIHMNSLCI